MTRRHADVLQLAECASYPSQAFPKGDKEPADRTNLYIAGGAVLCVSLAAAMLWKKNSGQ